MWRWRTVRPKQDAEQQQHYKPHSLSRIASTITSLTMKTFITSQNSCDRLFNNNSYPTRLFAGCIRTFFDKLSQPQPIVDTIANKVLYFSLPYTAKLSLQICTQISRLISSAYPHLYTNISIPTSVSYFVPLYVCLISSPSRTKSPKPQDLVWFILLSVAALLHHIWA